MEVWSLASKLLTHVSTQAYKESESILRMFPYLGFPYNILGKMRAEMLGGSSWKEEFL